MLESLHPGAIAVDSYPDFDVVNRSDTHIDLRGTVAGAAASLTLTMGTIEGWRDKVVRTDVTWASGHADGSSVGQQLRAQYGQPLLDNDAEIRWKVSTNIVRLIRDDQAYRLEIISRQYARAAAPAGVKPPGRAPPVAPAVQQSPKNSVLGFVVGGRYQDAVMVAASYGVGVSGAEGSVLGVPGRITLHRSGDNLIGLTATFSTTGAHDRGFSGSPLLASLTGSLGEPEVQRDAASWSLPPLAVSLERHEYFDKSADTQTVEYQLTATVPGVARQDDAPPGGGGQK